ncbi:hypothetical protein OIU85_001240 [Salix viminalis]|uniref:NAD(P)-binding domain-containing protein n=1 Tax=Salix viminalis TaxID=40686 RepID=A0A9Q0VKV1_SALVM|nr:hypothetical protein OIU85_001240 [Salix viminalis]
MAPTLTSISFLPSTTPHSRLSPKNTRLTVFAKQAGPFSPFQFGKPKDDASSSEGSQNDAWFWAVIWELRRKDPGTVFVAGATGQAGIRIAQTLLREGFSVRAGVPQIGAAQELARVAALYKIISNEELKRLNAVESTFQDAESIAKAIGNASKVVVTIGPTENGPTSEVSTLDALQVIEAAQLAGVGHVAIIYDGNIASSSTYNVLDGFKSFFNNLFSQPQLSVPEFLQKVVETDVRYTLIKTSLTEDFSPESSYNLVVSAERSTDTDDYKVAKSQIALVVANVFSDTSAAENKVVEVFTSPSAPSRPVNELFSAIPEDGRRKVYAEAFAKAKAEEEARIAVEKASEAAKNLEEEAKKLSEQEAKAASLAEDAQEKAEAAGASVESFMSKAKEIGSGLSWEKLSSQISTTDPKLRPVKPKEEPKPKAKETESKTEVRKMFGGLFQQETIYIDDD